MVRAEVKIRGSLCLDRINNELSLTFVGLRYTQLRYSQGRIQDFGLGGALAGGLGNPMQQGEGAEPRGVWSEAPEARRMLHHQAEKNTYKESIQTDIV